MLDNDLLRREPIHSQPTIDEVPPSSFYFPSPALSLQRKVTSGKKADKRMGASIRLSVKNPLVVYSAK